MTEYFKPLSRNRDRTRRHLNDIADEAARRMHRDGRTEGQKYLSRELGRTPGITVLDGRVGTDDRDLFSTEYVCYDYAFWTRHKQPWARPGQYIVGRLMERPIPFLRGHGYEPVDTPQKDDLIVYALGKLGRHFGIVHDAQRMVIDSKFGAGPILRHGHDLVYTGYGDQFAVLRRS